jgi:heterodisulfide reductase subunit C
MDYFKELAVRDGISPAQPTVTALHQTFLRNIKRRGRVFEGGLLPAYWFKSGQMVSKLISGGMVRDINQAIKLFRRGRLAVLPRAIKGKAEVSAILRSS